MGFTPDSDYFNTNPIAGITLWAKHNLQIALSISYPENLRPELHVDQKEVVHSLLTIHSNFRWRSEVEQLVQRALWILSPPSGGFLSATQVGFISRIPDGHGNSISIFLCPWVVIEWLIMETPVDPVKYLKINPVRWPSPSSSVL